MDEKTDRGTRVRTGEKFGIVGYWINQDQTHPVKSVYIDDPNKIAPGVTTALTFIYCGPKKPTPLEISTLISLT